MLLTPGRRLIAPDRTGVYDARGVRRTEGPQPGIGYSGITINLRNKTGKTQPPDNLGTPLANDPRVREALDLSIDRQALNQVA